jgi:CMP-N-acetylneuraminic acid synthetase
MKNIKDVCFIIQARLNSERVPGKMIRNFNDSTLVDIAIQKLIESDAPTDQIYLSVHESELIEIGQKYPINIYQRSYESANVDNGIQLLFEWWNKLPFKYVIMISACNPLLKIETINSFIQTFLNDKHDGMFSVINKKNYFWSTSGNMINEWPAGQDLLNTKAVETTYEAAHCLYASRMDLIGSGKWCGSWIKKNDPVLFEVSELETFDIDYEWQFNVAEQLYKLKVV